MCITERVIETFGVRDDPLPEYADVAIAIGIGLDKEGHVANRRSSRNAWEAVRLGQEYIVDNILLIGGARSDKGITEAEGMRRTIESTYDLPPIVTEEKSTTTKMNADNALHIMKERGWKSAIICAEGWHARRVKATFARSWADSGCSFSVIKTYGRYGDSQGMFTHFLPFALYDTLAFAYGRFKGWN